LDNFTASRQDEIDAPPPVLVPTDKSGIEIVDENTTGGKSFHSSGVRDGALGEIGSQAKLVSALAWSSADETESGERVAWRVERRRGWLTD
jgi:hypothetical protein